MSKKSSVRTALLWGSAWGVGVCIIEFLGISSIENWGSAQQLVWWLLYWTAPFWCVVGALYVWLADRYVRRRNLAALLVSFFGLSLLSSLLQPPLSYGLLLESRALSPTLVKNAEQFAMQAGTIVPTPQRWSTLTAYHLWTTLFYGGLLITAYTLTLRDERIRHLLHQSAMARTRTEGLLDAERLQALQSQIDPSLLLDSMQELELRYRTDPERAERLLETLVDFLRYAMHGLRMPVSTVEAELKLARAFVELQRERGLPGAWRIVEDSASAPLHKFPSLLMLPLLALGGANGRPMLRISASQGKTVLSLYGLGHTLSQELRQQIRARLYTLYGEHFLLDSEVPFHNQLSITLQSP